MPDTKTESTETAAQPSRKQKVLMATSNVVIGAAVTIAAGVLTNVLTNKVNSLITPNNETSNN